MEPISSQLFELDLNIRYVAINQRGQIVEMEQNPRLPSYNPPDTDRMEELVVNPVVLELAKRRGTWTSTESSMWSSAMDCNTSSCSPLRKATYQSGWI